MIHRMITKTLDMSKNGILQYWFYFFFCVLEKFYFSFIFRFITGPIRSVFFWWTRCTWCQSYYNLTAKYEKWWNQFKNRTHVHWWIFGTPSLVLYVQVFWALLNLNNRQLKLTFSLQLNVYIQSEAEGDVSHDISFRLTFERVGILLSHIIL